MRDILARQFRADFPKWMRFSEKRRPGQARRPRVESQYGKKAVGNCLRGTVVYSVIFI